VVTRKNAPEDDGEWRKLASGMEDGARRREWRMELDAAARMEGGKSGGARLVAGGRGGLRLKMRHNFA
jgi:hypothetical protein